MKTAYSTEASPQKAVEEIQNGLSGPDPRMVLFFASAAYDQDTLAAEMRKGFEKSEIIGCTSAGEIVSGKMLKNSVVAMSFDPDDIADLSVAVIEDVHRIESVDSAMKSLEDHFKKPLREMNPKEYIGFILIDGLSVAEEKVMDRIGDLTEVYFIGGSAGDDLKFQKTHVFVGDKALSGAAVLAIIKPSIRFDLIKTQSFCTIKNKFLTATKVDEARREVIEFDGKPAAQAYADALGMSVEDAENQFMHNPVGVMVIDEPYVRSPQQIKDGRMVFYCNVKEGMKLALLSSTDIVDGTRKAVQEKEKEMGKIRGIVNFHCILRTLELEDKGTTQPYADIFANIPTVGFSTYGEQFIGHINQTSTMVVFGDAESE